MAARWRRWTPGPHCHVVARSIRATVGELTPAGVTPSFHTVLITPPRHSVDRELGMPLTAADTSELAEAELEHLRYWRPSTGGGLMFSWWD